MNPLLVACLGVLVGAIATRCPPVDAMLPGWVPTAVVGVVGAVLLLVGLLERRTPRTGAGPVWMQLPRVLSLCLAAGLSFFTTVFAQTVGVSLGPVDPSFPANVPQGTALLWFFVFTVGFLGVGMMSAPSLMVPLLRVLTVPFAKLPAAALVPLTLTHGALFAVGLVFGANAPVVQAQVARVRDFFDANATLGTLSLVAIAVVPQLLGGLTARSPDAS